MPPGKDLIFQINASFSGAYDADPIEVRTFGLVASAGTGNSISTFVAVLYNQIPRIEKFRLISILEPKTLSTYVEEEQLYYLSTRTGLKRNK